MNLKNIKNLVFSGGGLMGLQILGSLQCLLENEMEQSKIQKISGCSVGSIIGFLFALKFTPQEMLQTIIMKNLQSLVDMSLISLPSRQGLDNGNKMMGWIQDIISVKGVSADLTFIQLEQQYNVQLFVNAVDISSEQEIIFNSKNNPNMKILEAIRCSISLPIIFTPVRIDNMVLVDGGVLNNLPIEMMDFEETLGISLYRDQNKKCDDFMNYLYSVVNTVMQKQKKFCQKAHILELKQNTDQTFNLKLSQQQKKDLYQDGYNQTINILNNYKIIKYTKELTKELS